MTQVFENDIAALNTIEIISDVVGCAVSSIEEALILLELFSADGAAPCDKPRRNTDVSFQLVGVLVELFDEVESTLVVRTVPELDVDLVAFLFDRELG